MHVEITSYLQPAWYFLIYFSYSSLTLIIWSG